MSTTPERTLFSLSFSRCRNSPSFFVILSNVPSLSIFSMFVRRFTLLRIVVKFVSDPPSQRSLT